MNNSKIYDLSRGSIEECNIVANDLIPDSLDVLHCMKFHTLIDCVATITVAYALRRISRVCHAMASCYSRHDDKI